MAARRKTWTQKWAEAKAKPELPKVINCESSGQSLLIPGPGEIEAIVREVPSGRVIGMDEITKQLAARHGADTCCPMTTGIFTWLMSYASCEAQGLHVDIHDKTPIDPQVAHRGLPWWRVVKTGGMINPKYPGAPDLQKALLESEGVRVEQKGKNWIVVQ